MSSVAGPRARLDPIEGVAVVADADLLRQILRELLSFVLGLGEEPVRARLLPPAPAWATVELSASGRPLPPALARRLFEPFDDDGSDVGLGLFLPRALAVAHGGEVGMDVDGEHTTVWLRLPRSESNGHGEVGP